ncbi:chemotaxis protein CheW [Desulfonatronospira sp.]|uniref:chemotaxis protein CheW n=1 Tax=Desulfonatronospira sp. TaxID=1962951 RepID=UPI0025BAFBEC|nr:chemotaxis protein CheW [Desulfonatronospira sp.]
MTFYLDQELFGLSIDSVREVLEYTTITRVPRTADYMRGVINLRGRPVPVVDLRRKFGLDEGEQTVDTCIIIVEVSYEGESSIMGALVDGVQEVLDIPQSQIEDPPKLGNTIDMKFIRGLGRLEETFVIILDVQAIFSMEELASNVDRRTRQILENNALSSPGMQG